MAVPKRRRSQRSSRNHKFAWFRSAYERGRQALSQGIRVQRQQNEPKKGTGFGK
jgi:hypothetical protein